MTHSDLSSYIVDLPNETHIWMLKLLALREPQ